jgi:RND superfamily putative drug exporter
LTRTERIFAALGRFSVRYRWLIIAAWIAFAVVASMSLPSLGSEVNNNNSDFLPASSPSLQATALATPLLGAISKQSEIIIVAALVPEGAKGAAGAASAGVGAGVGVARLDSADIAAIAREVMEARAVPGISGAKVIGISLDGQAAQILVTARVSIMDVIDQGPIINHLEATFAKAAAPPGLQFHLAGTVATNVANQASSNSTGNKVQLLSFVFIIVLLLLIFRSVLAPLITLAPAGVALVVSMRLIGELGAHGLKVSEITELLLIVLMLGAGTDYGLFLVFRTREEIRSGLVPREAVARALARVGESITASAGTVVFALLSLLLASFGLYHDLGVPLATGVAVMLLAGLTLLPALLAVFGRAAFWPTRAAPSEGGEREGWWGRVAGRLVARPAVTLCVGVALFGGLSVAALGYYSSGFAGALNAPAGTDEAVGNALLAQHFPETSANPANIVFRYTESVWDHPGALVTDSKVLSRSALFSQLSGPLDPNGTSISPASLTLLHDKLQAPGALPLSEPAALRATVPLAEYGAYHSLVEFVSVDGHTVQFEASFEAGAQDSTAALNATPAVRRVVEDAGRASGAAASGLAGEAAGIYDVSTTANHDLVEIVPVAILAIGLLLALVLRSALAPLYLIVSVGLSYLAALGLSTLAFIDVAGSDGITFILPFLMFLFLLALGEDYNILVMTRIREEARRQPLAQAVVHAIGKTGPTVTSAGMVLAGTFGVLAFEAGSGPSGSQIRDVGFGLAIGILMDTFLVRTLLVPSTVALLGRANWWPSRLAFDGPGEQGQAQSEAVSG